MDYETAKTNLEDIIKWNHDNDEEYKRNEATTRFLLIDRLLEKCLGWSLDQFELERAQNGEYTDYELGHPIKRLVVEAKREGKYFELPAGFNKTSCKIKTLFETSKEIQAAIEQAMGYCQKRGIQIGAVSNGHQLIAFMGTRHDGIAPEDGLAIVFDSLESMRDNFLKLWNNLSQKGISENNIISTLLEKSDVPPPEKLSTKILDFPGYKNRNPVAAELQILGGLFLEDIAKTPQFAEDFVRNTYCDSGALSQYALVSREILSTRYTSYFEKDTKVTSKPVRTKRGIQPELHEDLLAAGISQRPILLVGDVGVGKSMFIKHLLLVDAKEALKNSVVLYLDFGSKPTLIKELFGYVINEFNRQLKEDYSIDIHEKNFVRGVYNGEIQRFAKGIYGDLAETNPALFKEKEIENLNKLLQNEEAHLKACIKHIVNGQKKKVVIFLDNVDQREFEFQEQVFLISQAFAQDWPVTSFVALRPDTFSHSRVSGSLSAYQPRVFTIDPPRVDKVIQKRLKYALDVLKETGNLPNFPKGVNLSSKRLESYIEMLSSAFEKSEEVIKFVDNMSNGNLRKALDFIVSFVGSAHVDTEKIFRVIEDQGNYTLPLHEFLRSVIFQDNEYYNPEDSQIFNLYDISTSEKNEHFLSSILISYVERMGSIGGSEGFVLVSDIFGYLQGLGFTERQIHSSIQRITKKDLLTSPRIDTPTMANRLRIQSAGAYTIKRLANLFTYTDAIITDTPIISSEYRSKIQTTNKIEERLDRVLLYLSYLDSCWDKSLTGVYDWLTVSQSVKNDVSSIKYRLANRNHQ
jgi:hypothetical protein